MNLSSSTSKNVRKWAYLSLKDRSQGIFPQAWCCKVCIGLHQLLLNIENLPLNFTSTNQEIITFLDARFREHSNNDNVCGMSASKLGIFCTKCSCEELWTASQLPRLHAGSCRFIWFYGKTTLPTKSVSAKHMLFRVISSQKESLESISWFRTRKFFELIKIYFAYTSKTPKLTFSFERLHKSFFSLECNQIPAI